MEMRSLLDWWLLVRRRGATLVNGPQIYPAPMSLEQRAALDVYRANDARRRCTAG